MVALGTYTVRFGGALVAAAVGLISFGMAFMVQLTADKAMTLAPPMPAVFKNCLLLSGFDITSAIALLSGFLSPIVCLSFRS